jgi:hypothetical protein
MVPPAIQSHTMVVSAAMTRDPNVMDIDTQEAMVALGYEQVTPAMLGYEQPAAAEMGYGEAAPDMGYEEAAPDMGYGDATPDMGYGDATPDMGYGDGTPDAEMGYESAEPDMGYGPAEPEIAAPATNTARRGSMSAGEQTQRRASIKAIMNDPNVSPMAKRRSIHHLMDGRRGSMNGASGHPAPAPDLSAEESSPYETDQENYNHETTRHFSTNDNAKHAEQKRPPCTHYERKCTLIAPCCGTAFGCRICHDDCATLPPKINPKVKKSRYHRSASLPSSFTSMALTQPEDTHHTIDRFAIQEVICRECFTRQSSKTYVYQIISIALYTGCPAQEGTLIPMRARISL